MRTQKKKNLKVLMIGPDRLVRGGISTVVDSYYQLGLDEKIHMEYLPTMKDGNKIRKMYLAVNAYFKYNSIISQFDIVHIHMAAQASFTRKAIFIKKAYKAGKKIVIHQHAADFDEFYFNQSNNDKRCKIKEIFGMADRIVVLSEEWADFFGTFVCDREKIVVIHNGVLIPEFEGKDYKNHNILFLGRLGERKGIYDLIKVMPKIIEEIPDAMFYLGGDGDLNKCNKIVRESNISNNVRFLGWIKGEDKEKYLKACSIFILPSYHEGMPMAVLEAMSYGLATISTNVGGMPQIIENGVNGVCIEAGDIRALEVNLIELLKNKSKRKTLGMAARERIESKFDASKNIDILCKLYQSLMEENK